MDTKKEIRILHEEIEAIKERNRRVERDKAWETSMTRSIFIAIVSFILAYVLMLLIAEQNPFPKAIIGALLYLLSTSTYGILKNWWLKRQKQT